MKALAITQFKITTPSGIFVSGEYEGNSDSGNVVVFVHGFGVKRDSRGMFTDISRVLNNKFLIVRYDSFLTEENNETQRKVLEYSKQAEMLTAVLEYIGREFRPAHVYIIAHSMGGAVVSVTDLPHVDKIILFAPSPPKTDETIKNYHKNRKHSHINENGKSVLSHSDGTQSIVDTKFWQEMKNIDQFNLYKKLARKHKVVFVRALKDQVITNVNYEPLKTDPNIQYFEISANHDFEGAARTRLIRILKTMLCGE